MTDITDVFFDLDHTLWDFDRNSALAFHKVFEVNNLSIPLDEFLPIYLPINKQYWKWYRENRVTKSQLRHGRLSKTFSKLGISYTDDFLLKLSEDYIAFLPLHNHLFSDAVSVLRYLSQKFRLHIITNGFEEVQHKKLKASGLSAFFQTVTTSEGVGVKKPDKAIFYHALTIANTTAEASVMIGDTYEADIVGAQNVGMNAICFNYHKAILPDDVIAIDNLNEIKSYL